MKKQPKKYSKSDIEKIRKRATEIWKHKRESMQTAIDDWLEAERELKAKLGIHHKSSDQYTELELNLIRSRAQQLREEKVASLETAFNDWIEAEQELQHELKGQLALDDLFESWFKRTHASLEQLLKASQEHDDDDDDSSSPYDICGKHYIELMSECMK